MTADGGVDPDVLGRSTWTFLHTLAATQPQKLTDKDQVRLRRFVTDFSQLYPCAPCAESFQQILLDHPPVTTSGPQFAQWMCVAHNQVNQELGKPKFDCATLSDTWGVCEECAAHKDDLTQFKSLFKRIQSQ